MSNPVLWSHYADKHKGVCLGFDVKEDLLEEVKYADELLRVRLSDDEDPPLIPDELQQLLMVTKFRQWEYEKRSQKVRAVVRKRPKKETFSSGRSTTRCHCVRSFSARGV